MFWVYGLTDAFFFPFFLYFNSECTVLIRNRSSTSEILIPSQVVLHMRQPKCMRASIGSAIEGSASAISVPGTTTQGRRN
jgi:hypothetical protein